MSPQDASRIIGQVRDDLALLQNLRRRLEAVGLIPPSNVVRYQYIHVTSKVTVRSRALPSITGAVSSRIKPSVARHTILHNISGLLLPARFTLLLGPPQSGKTTFLRTLAGLSNHEPGLRVSYNKLTYNGDDFSQFVVQRSAAYVSQIDIHYGELTVREAMEFSARVQRAGLRAPLFEELECREKEQGITPDPLLEAFTKQWQREGRETSSQSL